MAFPSDAAPAIPRDDDPVTPGINAPILLIADAPMIPDAIIGLMIPRDAAPQGADGILALCWGL